MFIYKDKIFGPHFSKFFIYLSVFFVVFAVFVASLPGIVKAEDGGNWVDLRYLNVGDVGMQDVNPYDDDQDYSNGGCRHANGFDLDDPGTVTYHDCNNGSREVTLSDTHKATTGAYRLDQDNIIIVVGIKGHGDVHGTTSNNCANEAGGDYSTYDSWGLYRRAAEGFRESDNEYRYVESDNSLNEYNRLFTEDGGKKFRLKIDRSDRCASEVGWNSPQLKVAEDGKVATSIPSIYGVEPGVPPVRSDDASIGDAEAPDVNCEVSLFNPLTWIACPLIEAAQKGVETFDAAITRRLEIPLDYFDTTDPTGPGTAFYKSWSVFRYLALVLLVIIGLVMVIAQATSWDVISAYTIKSVIPKIFIAVIGISLSWILLSFAVEITNAMGIGVRAIIYAPFVNIGGGPSLGQGAGSLLTFGAGAALFSLGMLGILSFGLTALLAVMIGFGVIVFREVVVMMLAVTAPIAIICWILPNTQKVWKIWSDFFLKALLAFPVIAMMIATGHVMSQVVSVGNPGLLETTISFILYFGPYFMIPTAFKMAGGALATISGMAGDKTRGGFDRLKNFRKGQRDKNWENTKSGKRFKGGDETNLRGKLNRNLMKGTMLNQAGINPLGMRRKLDAAGTARSSELMAKGREDNAVKTVLNNDDLLDAYEKGGGTTEGMRKYYKDHLGITGDEAERNIAMVEHAQRAVGADTFGAIAAVANAGTGTGYGGGSGEMLAAANRASRGNSHLKAQIIAEQRGAAERARRGDLYGGSFSENMKQADNMQRDDNSEESIAAANLHMAKQALKGKSAHELASGRAGAVKNLIPAMQARIQEASGNVQATEKKFALGAATAQDVEQARHEEKRVMAHTAAFLDAAGSANPEIAEDLGKQVFGMAMPGGPQGQMIKGADGNLTQETVGDRIATLRSDAEFGQYRREYGDARSAAAAGAGAEAEAASRPPQQQ